MSNLHVADEVPDDARGARIGGRPLAPAGTTWPRCARCTGPLRFIAQHPLPSGANLLLFQCENAPGACEEWAPDGGGNAALVVGPGPAMNPPAVDRARFPDGAEPTFGPTVALRDDDDDGDHRSIGILGGEPDWIQADETPVCCGGPMRFVLQLDESAHTQLNFCGGGAAYAFVCDSCQRGRYLIQQ
jgi:hypothetical protein